MKYTAEILPCLIFDSPLSVEGSQTFAAWYRTIARDEYPISISGRKNEKSGGIVKKSVAERSHKDPPHN